MLLLFLTSCLLAISKSATGTFIYINVSEHLSGKRHKRCCNCRLKLEMADYHLPKEFDELNETTPLGHNMLKYFQFEPGYVNVNHGSYGSLPKCIEDCRRYWQDRIEMCPDRFFRYELAPKLEKSVSVMAKYMNVPDCKDLAFIPNASAGVNAITRSLKFTSTDVLLFLSEAYGAVKKTIQYTADFNGVEHHEMIINFPFDETKLLEQVENELKKFNGRVKLTSVSHVSSVPTAIFPVKKLTQLCHRYGSFLLIDGAHVLGQIKIDIEDLDPDFYLSNGHKWLYTPRGSGLMYVKKELQPLIHPTVISWNYQLGYQREFHQLGTIDYTNFLTFPTALEFRRRLGEDRIINYMHNLAIKGAKILARLWNTEILVPEDQLGSMANIRLPFNDAVLVNSVVEKLFLSFRSYMTTFEEKGVWYARISAQIYNEEKDYEDIGSAVLDILKFIQTNPDLKRICDMKSDHTKNGYVPGYYR